MDILAIDPGTTQSAWVMYDTDNHAFPSFGIYPNDEMLTCLRTEIQMDKVIIEEIASFGMPVGREVFRTVRWCGQFQEAYESRVIDDDEVIWLPRKEVCLTLCGSARAKDANIRQAVLDSFKPTGGGATPQIGTKKQPGPLHGFSADVWQAAGVALAWWQQQLEAQRIAQLEKPF